MEEAELLKERLLAITDKRKLQEDIAQKRHKVEEEKLKLHHLKKKALRERWLLDGLSTLTPTEQEEMLRQNQEDQQKTNLLECNITRHEQEIEALEKAEVQLSAKEVRVLQRLKSVERTTEDIIKEVKAKVREEPVNDIYAGIPDLPASFKPIFIKRMETAQQENGEEHRKALFALEIKVAKDVKTGESTVLSSIPVNSAEFKAPGVKVYDDGRKSVYAVSAEGSVTKNGMDTLAPVEVEDLLRKATKKSSQSPTEYHEPVFSNQYGSSAGHKGDMSPKTNGHNSPLKETYENGCSQNTFSGSNLKGKLTKEKSSYPKASRDTSQSIKGTPEEPIYCHSQPSRITQRESPIQDKTEHQMKTRENHHEAMFMNSGNTTDNSSGFEDDLQCSIVHATPCYVDDSEPVTMIFMGYQHADDNESKPISDYEGIIHAELVVIDDDEDDDKMGEEQGMKGLAYPPITQQNQVFRPATPNDVVKKLPNQNINLTLNNRIPYKNSISLQEQEASLGRPNSSLPTKQIIDDGTEDPSLTALRIRMAKLGKKVI